MEPGIVAVLAALGVPLTVAGSIVVARITASAAAKASPYQALADRVVHLEDRVSKLEGERDAARGQAAILSAERDQLRGQLERERAENRAYIRRLLEAVQQGRTLPTPPSWYVPEPTD